MQTSLKSPYMSELEKDLVLGCNHILKALESGEAITINEVLEETFACDVCAKKEPQSQKEFMDMFATICKGCINGKCK